MRKFVTNLHILSRLFGHAPPTWRTWKRRGIVQLEKAKSNSVVFSARDLVAASFVAAFAHAGARGRRLKKLWAMVKDGFQESDRHPGVRPWLWCDVPSGVIRVFCALEKGRPAHPPEVKMWCLPELERDWQKAIDAACVGALTRKVAENRLLEKASEITAVLQ